MDFDPTKFEELKNLPLDELKARVQEKFNISNDRVNGLQKSFDILTEAFDHVSLQVSHLVVEEQYAMALFLIHTVLTEMDYFSNNVLGVSYRNLVSLISGDLTEDRRSKIIRDFGVVAQGLEMKFQGDLAGARELVTSYMKNSDKEVH